LNPHLDSAEDKKIAAAAAEMIENIQNFEDALLDMMDAVGKGVRCSGNHVGVLRRPGVD